MSHSRENTVNVGALVGGLLCLVSMFLPYVVYRLLGVVLYRVSLITMIRVLQPYMLALPVVGAAMAVMAFCRNKTWMAVTAAAAVAAIVYFLISANGMINNENIQWLVREGGALIKNVMESAGISGDSVAALADPEQLAAIVRTVESLQHVGTGFLLYCLGTIIYVVSIFVNASAKKTASRKTDAPRSGSSVF